MVENIEKLKEAYAETPWQFCGSHMAFLVGVSKYSQGSFGLTDLASVKDDFKALKALLQGVPDSVDESTNPFK